MAAAGANNNIHDELLPELEMYIIPSKLTDNVKVDLFGLDDAFLLFLVERGHIQDSANNDTHYMSMSQAVGFCKTIRDMYRLFNTEAFNADL